MRWTPILIVLFLVSACELDARRENMVLKQENEELRLQLHLSTEYIEDVTTIIDEVQRNLQQIRDREGIIDRISLSAEGGRPNAVNVRRELVNSISDIDSYILDNRQKMELLAERIRDSQVRIGSLEEMVENLSVAVKQKEHDIATLKQNISRLEADLADLHGQIAVKDMEIQNQSETISAQAQAIRDKEAIIREQEQAAATAYYVVDTKDELKKKGLIVEERSGFLGLGRTTRVGTISQDHFSRVPKTEKIIPFGPSVKDIEVISAHKDRPDLYTFHHSGQGGGLNISDTEGFWAMSEYLIIVADD